MQGPFPKVIKITPLVLRGPRTFSHCCHSKALAELRFPCPGWWSSGDGLVAPEAGCAQQSVLARHGSVPSSPPLLMPSPLSHHSCSSVSHFKPLHGNVLCHIWVNILHNCLLQTPYSRKADEGSHRPPTALSLTCLPSAPQCSCKR